MRKRIYHYGQQQDEDWHKLRIGKFTSSEIYRLMGEPTKADRAKEVVKRIKNRTLGINKSKVVLKEMNNDYMNYAWKHLYPSYGVTSEQCKAAKDSLKSHIKDGSPMSTTATAIYLTIAGIEQLDIIPSSAMTYIDEVAEEIIYKKQDTFGGSNATDWGNEYEYLAAITFKERNLYVPDNPKIAFCEIEGLETGCSPDDTENKTTPSEYKSPYSKKVHRRHLEITNDLDLLSYDSQKYYQMHHQIFVLGAEHGFWSSFDPRLLEMSPRHQARALHTIRVERNDSLCKQFHTRILEAIEVRDKIVSDFFGNAA